MATTSFDLGDMFAYSAGFGIVLPDGKALVITGTGSRSGYKTEKIDIPVDAVPDEKILSFEVRFALEAVAVAIK